MELQERVRDVTYSALVAGDDSLPSRVKNVTFLETPFSGALLTANTTAVYAVSISTSLGRVS